jgi:peptide/nickel transport system ATP-binding protein
VSRVHDLPSGASPLAGTSGGAGLARTASGDPSPEVARVHDLAVTFDRRGVPLHALRRVSLEVRQGEILGLVGESGSGKTVLGLSLLGLLPTDPMPIVGGEVDVLGTDMLRSPDRQRRALRRRSLGAVFQDPSTSLNPTMTVGKQIAEASGSLEEAVRLLEAVGISNPSRRVRAYPHELSGGQQQRVMIAMAIAHRPALVIADEPTTALDVTVQSGILQLIADLRRELGCAFVLVTHDLGVAAEIADRIAVLYAGRLLEEGTTDDVLRRPAHPYTIGLLASRLQLTSPRDRPVVSLPGDVPDPESPPPGCPFAPRCELRVDACTEQPIPPFDVKDRTGHAACIRLEEAAQLRRSLATDAPWSRPPIGSDLALVVRGITKTFKLRGKSGSVQALRGVDLDVADGEAVALVGESGCGKSTLLRIVAGLERKDEGEVHVSSAGPQMIFQNALASLTPWLSVRELVGERLAGRRMSRSEIDAKVSEALTHVGLSPKVARARSRQLSGGQAQRVALARAIVVPPGLLLADEPTSSLDVSLRAVILNLLNELRRDLGLSLLFVTHDLTAARVIADRIAVMHEGRIVEIGDADSVCTRPRDDYTRRLLASLPGEGRSGKGDRWQPKVS